jgi:hypothetical protein
LATVPANRLSEPVTFHLKAVGTIFAHFVHHRLRRDFNARETQIRLLLVVHRMSDNHLNRGGWLRILLPNQEENVRPVPIREHVLQTDLGDGIRDFLLYLWLPAELAFSGEPWSLALALNPAAHRFGKARLGRVVKNRFWRTARIPAVMSKMGARYLPCPVD